MKLPILIGLALAAAPLLAADANPKDEIKAAAKKLAEAANYSWKSTPQSSGSGQGGGRFRAGPTEGKTEKDGFTWLSMSRGESTTEAAIKGGKAAVKTEEGWKTTQELSEGSQEGDRRNRGRFLGRMLENYKAPVQQAEDLLAKAKELKKADDGYSGDLTEEGVKELLTFGGRRRDGSEAPAPTNAKGSVKFWVKDGVLAKYEFKVQGTANFGGNDVDIDRTTVVEVKDVGSTKVEVPAEAKAKLGA
ncbi:MAG: hypothetical protein ACR2OZ_01410 [Verrucomicrobiales bacterium]